MPSHAPVLRRAAAVACCLLLVGCGAAVPEPTPTPTQGPAATATAEVPEGAVLMESLGYQYAPEGFMLPGTSTITERVDQPNAVVAVFTAPSGLELASFLRKALPADGWTITADGQNSLLFERGELRGGFTVTGQLAALSIRGDAGS